MRRRKEETELFPRKKHAESVAIALAGDRIDVVRLRRGRGRDRSLSVLHCSSHRKEEGEVACLTRLQRMFRLQRARCIVPLQVGEYQMLQVEPPAVPPEEVKAAVRWRIKEMIDYPPEDATVDVLEIPEDPKAVARNLMVYVVCSPNATIQRYVRLFQSVRIPLEIIDIPELAQRNVAGLFETAGRATAFLSFDGRGTLLTVSAAGELYLARRVELTLEQLGAAQADQRSAMLERLLVELQRSLDNLERQFRSLSVARLLVAPTAEDLKVREYLAQNLYLPVETADLHSVMDLSATPDLDDPVRQAACLPLIGAALRELQGAA